MGWLASMAKETGHNTFGKLARAAVQHAAWPSDETGNERSLENLLRLIDRSDQKGLIWLDNRPAVRDVLADLLSVSAETLDPRLSEVGQGPPRRIELAELREARPLDLQHEALFPGIPDAVLRPDEWGLCWWCAPAGAGKTIAGQWLEARRKAVFLRGDRWSDVARKIPDRGAVYIELTSPDSSDDVRFPAGLEGRNVCVAAPFLPVPAAVAGRMPAKRDRLLDFGLDDAEPAPGSGFETVDGAALAPSTAWRRLVADPKEEWVEPLIRWVGDRMAPGGGFEIDSALQLVRKRFFATSLVTPGDYIGVCGVIEKRSAKGMLAGVTIEQLALAFLDSRGERSDLAGRHTWPSAVLWRLFVGCVEGAAVHGTAYAPFPSELALRGWLPSDSLPLGDESAAQRILDDPSLTIDEVAAIRRQARPSPEGAAKELFRLHLLEPCGEGAVALRPAWLVPLAREQAFGRLIEQPSRGLGEVLLQPQAAASVLLLMCTSIANAGKAGNPGGGDAPAADLNLVRWSISHLDVADPASVAVVEGCFQAVGVALLDQGVTLPDADLQALWVAQMRVAMQTAAVGLPRPRLLAVKESTPAWEGAWEVACLTISERLHRAGLLAEPTCLAPWGAAALPEFTERLSWGLRARCLPGDEEGAGASSGPSAPLLNTWRLVGRLYRSFGDRAFTPGFTQLTLPFEVLDAARSGGGPPSGQWWVTSEAQLDIIERLAADVGVGMDGVLSLLWRVRPGAGAAGFSYQMLAKLTPKWRERVWAALPPELLREELRGWIESGQPLAWSALLPAHWDVILDSWHSGVGHTRHGLAAIPAPHARRMFAERLFGHDTRNGPGTIWGRFPDIGVDESIRELVEPPETWAAQTGGSALWCAPSAQVGRIVEGVRPHLQAVLAHETARRQLVHWAHWNCGQRGDHWREAWKLLVEVDPM